MSALWMRRVVMVVLVCAGLAGMGMQAAQAAAVRLEVPQRVARGDAFLLRVWCDAITGQGQAPGLVQVQWRGKSLPVPLEPNAQNAAEKGASVAVILLSVPVDEKADGPLPLVVRLPQGERAQTQVALYSRERPVQKLTVEGKFVNPPAKEKARIAADRRKVRAVAARYTPQRAWGLPLLRPVPGEVSSLFGLKRVFNGEPRSVHKGLDLRGAQGEPIRAVADGEVALVDNLYFSGNAVYVDHGLGVVTAYLHMSKTLVQPGQSVRRGDTLGLVGATGRVTGPHLHFTLLVQGVHADPLPLLEQEK